MQIEQVFQIPPGEVIFYESGTCVQLGLNSVAELLFIALWKRKRFTSETSILRLKIRWQRINVKLSACFNSLATVLIQSMAVVSIKLTDTPFSQFGLCGRQRFQMPVRGPCFVTFSPVTGYPDAVHQCLWH